MPTQTDPRQYKFFAICAYLVPDDKRHGKCEIIQRHLTAENEVQAERHFMCILREVRPNHAAGMLEVQELPRPFLESIAGLVNNRRRQESQQALITDNAGPASHPPTEH